MTWTLLTRWSRDSLDTLAEAQWVLRHLAWSEDDGAYLGMDRGRVVAAIYPMIDELEEDDEMTTTYSNPMMTTDMIDRAWPIAAAYCRARVAVGLRPDLEDGHALSHGDDLMADALRTAIYEWCQMHTEALS